MKRDLQDLLAEFIERRENGETVDPASFLAEHPEGGDPLRNALQTLAGTEALLPSTEQTPRSIGPWQVLGPLNRGGMGMVLRVRRSDDDRDYALKLLSDASFANPRAHARLQREGEALLRLQDPGIVRCIEIGQHQAMPYLVMELVDGHSLAEIVHLAREHHADKPAATRLDALLLAGRTAAGPGSSGFTRIALLVAELAQSVSALHRQGLLHRDLKPANVVLQRCTGKPVVLDFGLVGGDDLATLTNSGDVLGTPAYMAPEQARGENLDATADVFGLGAILYELLVLEAPRQGQGSWSVLEEVRSRPVASPRKLHPSIPRSLERITNKALAWHRRFRYSNVEALAKDLRSFAASQAQTQPLRGPAKPVRQRLAEAWQFHRVTVTATLVAMALTPILLLLASSSAVDPERINRALAQALDAWAIESPEARQTTAALATLSPEHPATRVLTAIQNNLEPSQDWDDYSRNLMAAARLMRADKLAAAQLSATAASRLRPRAPTALFLSGWAAARQGDRVLARQQLAAAVRLLPRSQVVRQWLAGMQRRDKQLAEADRTLQRAFDLGPGYHELWLERARLRLDQQRLAEGLQDIDQALAACSTPRPIMLNVKGVILDSMERRTEARAVFDQLRRLHPKYSSGCYNRARAFDSDCRLDEARQAYEEAIRIEPRHMGSLLSLAWLHAGSNRAECKKCQAAFAAKPELLDVDLAERYLLRGVAASKGRSTRVLRQAVDIAKRVKRRSGLRQLLVKLRDRPNISDSRYGRLSRMLVLLDR